MSYRTDFWLNIVGHPNTNDLPDRVKDCVVNSYNHTVSDLMCGEASDISWSSCESDMENLSRNFPEYIFELTGYGQEHEDMWVIQARKGKIVYKDAEVIWPTFSAEDFEE